MPVVFRQLFVSGQILDTEVKSCYPKQKQTLVFSSRRGGWKRAGQFFPMENSSSRPKISASCCCACAMRVLSAGREGHPAMFHLAPSNRWVLLSLFAQHISAQELVTVFDPVWETKRRQQVARLEAKGRLAKEAANDCPEGYVHTFFIGSTKRCAPCTSGRYATRLHQIPSISGATTTLASCELCPAGTF